MEEDWPFFEGENNENYQLVRVDAVVSNPPYSQKWTQKGKEHDPRFSDYGVAPKGKADYAFLLHDLYHLEDDGVMTIVLPHGVLFRGNEEYNIRKNLIEKNNIDAIIGLPANVFFGTSIPTLIMVLKRHRKETDTLIINASRGYEKVDKSNRLRSSDIKRIIDCIRSRAEIPGFSVRVSKEEIRENDYNLNIPRYVDSFEKPESWDLHAIMFGGIPNEELDLLEEYWNVFLDLRDVLCIPVSERYAQFASNHIGEIVRNHKKVREYFKNYTAKFATFRAFLHALLIENYRIASPTTDEEKITEDIFSRLKSVPLIDKYEAYQVLDDVWNQISTDLEVLHTEGNVALTQVDPHIVTKKKNDKEVEVQEGWEGHILPFELVQEIYFTADLQDLRQLEQELADISSSYNEVIDSLGDEEKESGILNDNGTAFVTKEVKAKVDEMLDDIESEEILALQEYLELSLKEKRAFVEKTSVVDWGVMEASKKGIYTKPVVVARIKELKQMTAFPDESFEAKLMCVLDTIGREAALKKEIREKSATLHNKIKVFIENMSEKDALATLEEKWITPIISGIDALPERIVTQFIEKLIALQEKYCITFSEVGTEIEKTETAVSDYLSQLNGDAFDMEGLNELRKLLGESNNG